MTPDAVAPDTLTPGAPRDLPPLAALALRAVDAACHVAAAVAALAAAGLAVILIAEVLLTSFANWSQPWAVEYATYLQCFVLFLGSGWALRQGGHIRVAVLLQMLPPPAARALDMAATAFAAGTVGFAAFALWPQLFRTVAFESRSFYPMATPLWVPQALLTIGVTLLLLAFLARLLRLALGQPPELGTGLTGGGHE